MSMQVSSTYAERLARLRQRLKYEGLDALLLSSAENVLYVVGIKTKTIFDVALVVITADRFESFVAPANDWDVSNPDARFFSRSSDAAKVVTILKSWGWNTFERRRIGFEAKYLSVGSVLVLEQQGTEILTAVPTYDIVENLRATDATYPSTHP